MKAYIITSKKFDRDVEVFSKFISETFIGLYAEYVKPVNKPMQALINESFEKIEESDFIIVLGNEENEMVDNWMYEIAYAKRFHKPIIVYNTADNTWRK